VSGRRWVRSRFWLGVQDTIVPIFPGQRYVLRRVGFGWWTRLDWTLEEVN
jgi:hypothetical protein